MDKTLHYALILCCLLCFGNMVSAQQNAVEKQMIVDGQMEAPSFTPSNVGSDYNFIQPKMTKGGGGCFIEPDSTYTTVTYETCSSCPEDDASSALIPLPFTYDICGFQFDAVYINTNGNITFDAQFTTFTPVGIPNNTTAVMVAPYWSDVDFNGTCGEFSYKIEPNRMIVTWVEVGYYQENCDLFNTFQVVITDGTDPSVGIGNNTAFYYGDMNWTTGDASQGVGGFGGAPAVVGINANDGVTFDVIGEFDQAGNSPSYIDPYGVITPGGVDWLDFQCFEFPAGNCAVDVCAFSNATATGVCDGTDYNIDIVFGASNGGASGYQIFAGNYVLGPFLYESDSAAFNMQTIEGIGGNPGDILTVSIADIDDPACFETMEFEVPDCGTDCPTFLYAETISELCSGATSQIVWDVDNYYGNAVATFALSDGTLINDPNDFTIINNDCVPAEYQIEVSITCIEDSTIVLTETLDVVVYPNSIEPFVGVEDGECDITVNIQQGCEDYIEASFNSNVINPGVAGTLNVDFNYAANAACADPVTLEAAFDCPLCELSELSLTASDCAADGFMVELNVTAEDNSDSFMVMDGNGVPVGTFNYADLPITLGPYNGDGTTEYSFTLTDAANPDCTITGSVGPVDCNCSIDSFTGAVGECTEGGVIFTVDLAGTLIFGDVTITDQDGNNLGNFDQADFPVDLGPFPGDNVTDYVLTASANGGTCTGDLQIGVIDCLCEITSFTVTPLDCTGESFNVEVEVDLEGNNIFGEFDIQDQFGNFYGSFEESDFPVVVGPLSGDFITAYEISAINPNAMCEASVTLDPIDCLPCEINGVTATVQDCDGFGFNVEIDVDAANTSDSFVLTDNVGGYLGQFNYADLPITVGPYDGDNATTYSFTVTDFEEGDCTASVDVGPVECYVCDSGNLVVEGVCNGVDVATFDVYISFTGNNLYSVTDQDGNVYLSGITSGDDIFVGAFPNYAELTFTVSDDLVEDCELIESIDCVLCDPSECNSVGGTIMANATYLCPDQTVIVDADDFLLMPKQSVYYLFHTEETVTETDLPDLNNDVYTTGSFLTNDGTGVPYGTIVYVTAIGAQENQNMPGFPNYNDVCLTVSNTIPIFFLAPIEITVTEDCDNSSGEFTFSFEVSGGFPGLNPGATYDIGGDYYFGEITAGETVLVGPITDGESYTITAEDQNGCTGETGASIDCEKLPVELLSFTGDAIAEGNLLKWVTATEIENDYFTLEHSADGNTFTEIAIIDGAGTVSTTQSYEHLDKDAPNGVSYYRLKQTDFDGSYAYAQTITVIRGEAQEISFVQLYPQPADQLLTAEIVFNADADVQIVLADALGRIVMERNENFANGLNKVELDIADIAKGFYTLSLITDELVISEKVIIE